MPDIQTGKSVNFFMISSDASNTAAAPLQGIEQSNNRKVSVRGFDSIISSIENIFLKYAQGLSIAFRWFLAPTYAISSSVVPYLRICALANMEDQYMGCEYCPLD